MNGTGRIRVMCGNGRTWARAAGAVVVMLIASGPAHAFYWHNWPGSGIVVQQTIITPRHQNSPANPPSTTPPVVVTPGPIPGSPKTPPPPVGPPVAGEKPPVGPQATPEPATGLLGLLGLGALTAVRRWRKRM